MQKQQKIALPSAKVGDLNGFGSGGLTGSTADLAKAMNDFANNGKGIESSFKDTGLTNSAIRRKLLSHFLKEQKK